MYEIEFGKKFLKDLKKLKSNKNFKKVELEKVLKILISGESIPKIYNNHKLSGDLIGMYDLHVQNDLVLIYSKYEIIKLIGLYRIGSHSEIF